MKARQWWFAAALSLAVVPACKKDEGHTPSTSSGGTTLTITASEKSVVADGVHTVTLTLTNTTGSAVTVTTDRGTFSGGVKSVTTSAASAAIVLTTCNASSDSACAGTAVVTATGTQTASATIAFGSLADMCGTDCSVDTACGYPTQLACLGATGAGYCSTTNPSVCTVSGGGGGGGGGGTTGASLTVTPARTRLPANGAVQTDVVVQVKNGTTPTSGVAVTLSLSPSSGLGSLSATTGTTDANGKVTVTFTSTGTSTGVATITATSTTPALTGSATITMPRFGSFQFPTTPVQYTVLGVKDSGWREFGFMRVQVLDDTGAYYPDGLTVTFEHRPLGDSTLAQPNVSTGCATSPCVRSNAATTSGTGTPDTVGQATTWIYSGTIAGTLETVASTTVGGVTYTTAMPTVAVVGAKASAANFAIVCSPRNVPALAETNCSTSLVDAQVTCAAILKDRFNNVLGRSAQVIFQSEAAAVAPVTATPQYDPTKDASSQGDLGTAVQIFSTLGNRLPLDVAPQAGEDSYDLGTADVCGTRVHNPRDGVVTIIAVADGEEAFFDTNGDGVYTSGEPFVDQGEPFVDVNDDGTWNDGSVAGAPREEFLDLDGDGVYDPGNGTWDANGKIWTQTVVLYSGQPTTVEIAGTTTTYLGTRWAGTSFPGACTPTAAPADFALGLEETSDPYWVVASDMNLNLLHTETSYDAKVGAGSAKIEYFGLPKYADDLGFFYRYWPCDKAGSCAPQCRSTGTNLPCTMKPSVSSFWCGETAPVTITCGTKAEPARVDWTVSTPYERQGSGKIVIDTKFLSGTCGL